MMAKGEGETLKRGEKRKGGGLCVVLRVLGWFLACGAACALAGLRESMLIFGGVACVVVAWWCACRVACKNCLKNCVNAAWRDGENAWSVAWRVREECVESVAWPCLVLRAAHTHALVRCVNPRKSIRFTITTHNKWQAATNPRRYQEG